jgi:hypothetical protein
MQLTEWWRKNLQNSHFLDFFPAEKDRFWHGRKSSKDNSVQRGFSELVSNFTEATKKFTLNYHDKKAI